MAANEVERRLASEVDSLSADVSHVIVQAPAGFGKTSLLRALHRRRADRGEAVGWLSFDHEDNDPGRFLEHLVAALGGSPAADAPPRPLSGASASLGRIDGVIARIDELRSCGRRFSVFLDEVETIHEDAVVGLLRELSQRLPAHGTLFIAGRRTPDLHLARQRAAGRVADVGPDRLRFSLGEAEDLLARLAGAGLSGDLVAGLHRRTEGWPAALHLAGLSLNSGTSRDEAITGFAGSSAELGGYLAEEVLATQPRRVRDFLLRASVFETIDAELCDEVLGVPDAASLLRRIQRDNLLLARLSGETFRLHGLFREFLQRELAHRHPDALPQIHRRAAEWFAQQDRMTPAIRHALASGDQDFAADLIEAYAQPLTAAGRLTTLIRAVERLPAAHLEARPRLRAYYATCLVGTFQHRRAEPLIAELGEPGALDPLDDEALGVVLFSIPFQLLLQDRFADVLPVCEDHLARLGPEATQARAGLMNVRNVSLLHLHRFREIEDAEVEVRRLAVGATTYGLVYAECIAGMSELAQGRPTHAAAIFDTALATAVEESSPTSAPTAMAAACLAGTRYEQGDLDGARELLDRYLPTITHVGIPDAVVLAHVQHVRLLYRRQGYVEACNAINQLKRLGYERDLLRLVATAGAEHSRLALLAGDAASARRYLELAEASAPYATLWDESGATLRARLLTAEGHPQDAIALLQAELRQPACVQRRRYALKLRIVLGTAQYAAGEVRAAFDTLEGCLLEARTETYIQIFADEGPPLVDLLRELLATRDCGRDLKTYILCLLEHADAAPPPVTAAREPEPLSRREFEVLTHMAEGHSNQAIAEALFLSLPTVKTHVARILGKLAAKNRTEAVAAARRHQLLTP